MFKAEFIPYGRLLIAAVVLAVLTAVICVAADSVQPRRILHKSDRLMISCVAYTDGACDQVKIRMNKEAGNEESR